MPTFILEIREKSFVDDYSYENSISIFLGENKFSLNEKQVRKKNLQKEFNTYYENQRLNFSSNTKLMKKESFQSNKNYFPVRIPLGNPYVPSLESPFAI